MYIISVHKFTAIVTVTTWELLMKQLQHSVLGVV